MVRFVEALFLLVVYFSSTSEGSCWRYGHSCWGGHGKRAGTPPIIIPDTGTSTLPSAAPLFENGSEKVWDLVGGSSATQYQYQTEDIPLPGLSGGYNYYAGLAPANDNENDDIVTVKLRDGKKNRRGRDFLSYLTQTSAESPPWLDSAETPDGKFGEVGERLGTNQADYSKLFHLSMQLRPSPGEEQQPVFNTGVTSEEEQNYRENPASSIPPSSSLRNNWSLYRQRLLRHGK